MSTPPTPPRIGTAPDPIDAELQPLLDEPFASALAAPGAAQPTAGQRSRLAQRVTESKRREGTMHTTRLRRVPPENVAPGVVLRTLYRADLLRPLRPGEPLRACMLELQPGTRWNGSDAGHHREWLVLSGTVQLGRHTLRPRDYHVMPAGLPDESLHSADGARVFLRVSPPVPGTAVQVITVHDADTPWPDYAPGMRRRVLWQHDGQAALLYYAQPGASVPMHSHCHDEECLMVQGELFLDDVLLQSGDYQLAPAGTGHRVTETDTGVVLFAHGDLDLKFVVD